MPRWRAPDRYSASREGGGLNEGKRIFNLVGEQALAALHYVGDTLLREEQT